MKTEEWKWRYGILAFDALLGFGVVYNLDIPSVLQSDLQNRQVKCENVTYNSTCCEECLELGPSRYSQLYSVQAAASALFAIPAGFIIDRIGNRVAALIFTMSAFLGSLLFTISTLSGIKRTVFMFPLMLSGRILLGASLGSVVIVMDRVISFWFIDNVAFCLTIVIGIMRSGSVLNFLITTDIKERTNITTSLGIGVVMSAVSLLSAFGLFITDYIGTKKIQTEISQQEFSDFMTILRSIRLFSLKYWLTTMGILAFSSSASPLIGFGSSYLQERYGYSETTASYMNGLPYDLCFVLSPIVGLLFAKINKNGLCLLIFMLLYVPVFPFLAFYPDLHPLFPLFLFGVCYVVGVALLWSFIIQTVHISNFGKASGIATCLQGAGIGLTNVLIGIISESKGNINLRISIPEYQSIFMLLMVWAIVCLAIVIIINVIEYKNDLKQYKKLHESPDQALQCLENEKTPILPIDKEKIAND